MGQKTQPTVSKHWRKRSPKDQASIPLAPPHYADNNTTYMQYEKQKHKIHTTDKLHFQNHLQWQYFNTIKAGILKPFPSCNQQHQSTKVNISQLLSRPIHFWIPTQCFYSHLPLSTRWHGTKMWQIIPRIQKRSAFNFGNIHTAFNGHLSGQPESANPALIFFLMK